MYYRIFDPQSGVAVAQVTGTWEIDGSISLIRPMICFYGPVALEDVSFKHDTLCIHTDSRRFTVETRE